MHYEPGYSTSWAWRKICQVKNMFKTFLFNEDGTSKTRIYTLKEGYKWINGDSEMVEWWPWMTNRWITPKHSFIIWVIAHQRLLTGARMIHLNMTTSGKCYICDESLETVNHLFSSCRYSRRIFEELGNWCGTKLPEEDCIKWWLRCRERSAIKKKVVGVIVAASL